MAKFRKMRADRNNGKNPPSLVSVDDYREAPIGTIAAEIGERPIYKSNDESSTGCPDGWECINSREHYSSLDVSGVERVVLRWGRV